MPITEEIKRIPGVSDVYVVETDQYSMPRGSVLVTLIPGLYDGETMSSLNRVFKKVKWGWADAGDPLPQSKCL